MSNAHAKVILLSLSFNIIKPQMYAVFYLIYRLWFN